MQSFIPSGYVVGPYSAVRGPATALRVLDKIQQREGRWVIPDLVGKGNRLRTVTISAAVKVRIDAWIAAAKISKGKVFRIPVERFEESVWKNQEGERGAALRFTISKLAAYSRALADQLKPVFGLHEVVDARTGTAPPEILHVVAGTLLASNVAA